MFIATSLTKKGIIRFTNNSSSNKSENNFGFGGWGTNRKLQVENHWQKSFIKASAH
jgi:hypothetical protein